MWKVRAADDEMEQMQKLDRNIFLLTLFICLFWFPSAEFMRDKDPKEMKFSFEEIRKEFTKEKEECGDEVLGLPDTEGETKYGKSFDILAWVAANFGGCMLTEARFRMCVADQGSYLSDWMSTSDLAFILMTLEHYEHLFPKIKEKKAARAAAKIGMLVAVGENSDTGEEETETAAGGKAKMRSFAENEPLYMDYKRNIMLRMKAWCQIDLKDSDGAELLEGEPWEVALNAKFQDEVYKANAEGEDDETESLNKDKDVGTKKHAYASDLVDFNFADQRKKPRRMPN